MRDEAVWRTGRTDGSSSSNTSSSMMMRSMKTGKTAMTSSSTRGRRKQQTQSAERVVLRQDRRSILTVDVPLEPSIDTVDDDALHKALLSEYTCRYLEKIGAKPTRANIELVRRHLPLTKDCLKVQLKTRGAIKDEVSIVIPPVAYDVKPPELSLAPSLKKVLLTSSLARVTAGTPSEPGASSGKGGSSSDIDPLFEEEDPLTMIDNSTKEVGSQSHGIRHHTIALPCQTSRCRRMTCIIAHDITGLGPSP